jgi:hypothetical protein
MSYTGALMKHQRVDKRLTSVSAKRGDATNLKLLVGMLAPHGRTSPSVMPLLLLAVNQRRLMQNY